MVRQLNLSHPSNLHAVITIIGYRSQGESVIFRIVDGIETKYCLVVDSYKLKQRNVTLEFLIDKYNVSILICYVGLTHILIIQRGYQN